jgi:DNA polymerase III epsilon subunit-like protein
MPDKNQSQDIYTSRQLSLGLTGPQPALDSAAAPLEDQKPSNPVHTPHKTENVAESKPNAANNEDSPGSMPSVIEPGKEINSVIERKSSAKPAYSDRYLFVDLETGGLYPDKHAVLQVAALITDLDFNIKGQFMSYIQPCPHLQITKEALMINQLSLEHLQTAPVEKAVAVALAHFVRLVGDAPRFAGYNCQFDLEFLDHLWQRHDLLPAPYQVPWLDVYTVSKSRLGADSGLPNFKLISVASHFGLNTDGAHDALADLIMTIEVAKRLRALTEKPNSLKNGIDLETAKFTVIEALLSESHTQMS